MVILFSRPKVCVVFVCTTCIEPTSNFHSKQRSHCVCMSRADFDVSICWRTLENLSKPGILLLQCNSRFHSRFVISTFACRNNAIFTTWLKNCKTKYKCIKFLCFHVRSMGNFVVMCSLHKVKLEYQS